MLPVTCWLWGSRFGPEHVNVLRSMLARHLHIDHELHCFTNEPAGLDGDIVVHAITEFLDTPRCRRRMAQYGGHMRHIIGPRFLALDLDVILTDDVTPLFDNDTDVLKLWKIGYAGVYAGAVQLITPGVLDPLYRIYRLNPEELPRLASPTGVGSDQAMLNHYLAELPWEPSSWTDADGIVAFFGDGYEKHAHLGVGPSSERLPEGCRMVVMGSEDLKYLDMPLLSEHYR